MTKIFGFTALIVFSSLGVHADKKQECKASVSMSIKAEKDTCAKQKDDGIKAANGDFNKKKAASVTATQCNNAAEKKRKQMMDTCLGK